ncbi:MAG: hypothetical protein JO353_10595 [Phycisphaerae bacterium]|nr:hypothetical protein [Phycisphaerae bacterium]
MPYHPSDPPPHTAKDAIPHVPEQLLEELHAANEELGHAGRHRERMMDAPLAEETPRDDAIQKLREAEKHVEDVTEKINQALHQADESPAQSE